jgi:hypothetical protein
MFAMKKKTYTNRMNSVSQTILFVCHELEDQSGVFQSIEEKVKQWIIIECTQAI